MSIATSSINTTNDLSPKKRDVIYDGFSVQTLTAPFGKRLLALCVDYGILGLVSYLYFFVVFFLGTILFGGLMAGLKGIGAPSGASAATLILFYVYLVVVLLGVLFMYSGYFIYYEYKKGRTLGKKLFGLTVVTDNGTPLTLNKCFLREIFRTVDFLIVPGLISWAVTDRRQRLGDVMAGTFVAYSKQQEESQNSLYVEQKDYNYIYEVAQPAPELREALINQYLVFAHKYFLENGQNDPLLKSKATEWEATARMNFNGPDQNRLDQTTALLFFAEYCYKLDTKNREQKRKG